MPRFDQGVYEDVEITAQGFSQTPTKGTPYFFLTFKIGQEDGTITFWLTDGAIDFSLRQLEQLGWDRRGFDSLEPSNPGHHSFVGQRITVVNLHETRDGKTYDKFRIRGPAAEKPVVESKALKALNAKFASKLKPKAAAAAPPAKPAPTFTPEEIAAAGADDIPF